MIFRGNPHRNKQSLLGAPAFHASASRRSGISPVAITPDKVEIYPKKKEGVKGMLLLGCFPPGGREGVILQAAAENKRIETKEDFNRADKP
jgi:hypothetical protein